MDISRRQAAFVVGLLAVQFVTVDYFRHDKQPHIELAATFSEPQLSFAAPSVTGAEITTTASFTCPKCGGELGLVFNGMLREQEVRHRLGTEEAWCDAGCDWHDTLSGDAALRLSYGQWLRTSVPSKDST